MDISVKRLIITAVNSIKNTSGKYEFEFRQAKIKHSLLEIK